MRILGCDFHPSWQQIAWVETETGESGERKLVKGDGEAERFYRGLGMPALVGVGAGGRSQWFVELLCCSWNTRCGWAMQRRSVPAMCASRRPASETRRTFCGCWWKAGFRGCGWMKGFAGSISSTATAWRKPLPRWQQDASWRYDSTGCCAPKRRIGRWFASRAARWWPGSAQARAYC